MRRQLAPPGSLASDLLRLVAVYLALIVALQAVAAATALGRGPLHRHDPAGIAAAAALFAHPRHQHAWGERHLHVPGDAAAPATAAADDGLDLHAFALTAALALLAPGLAPWRLPTQALPVWSAVPNWAWATGLPELLFRPPRQG